MLPLTVEEAGFAQSTIDGCTAALERVGLFVRLRRNFDAYRAIRAANGDTHLNQAFDPRHTRFGGSDFWISVENTQGTVIAMASMSATGMPSAKLANAKISAVEKRVRI